MDQMAPSGASERKYPLRRSPNPAIQLAGALAPGPGGASERPARSRVGFSDPCERAQLAAAGRLKVALGAGLEPEKNAIADLSVLREAPNRVPRRAVPPQGPVTALVLVTATATVHGPGHGQGPG